MKSFLNIVLVLGLCVAVSACSREPSLKDAHFETVEAAALSNTLFFTGSILPGSMQVIPSPVDGVVMKTLFQYGDHVNAGSPLFMLSSGKFLSDYKSALLDYIKAKNEFTQNKTLLSEAEFLHKNLLISDDDYQSKKSTYFTSQLSYLQAKDALMVFLNQMNIKDVNLLKLSISDIDKITQAMHFQSSSDSMMIDAPVAGTILAPIKIDDGSVKAVSTGDAVKEGDVLAVIGDLSSISVGLKVNELTINQINVGQPVTITGIAFPGISIEGKVSRVDKQGEVSSGSLPTFSVQVSASLTPAMQKVVHVGMSANIQMNIEEPPQITIPISALVETNDASMVKVYDRTSGTIKLITVQTGKTTEDSVVIQSGLKSGDRIVVPH